MTPHRVDVIATTISGSIRDWSKVDRIVPLFRERGWEDVHLHVAESHPAVRSIARDLAAGGRTTLISAGGSGTFNRVIEGCIDAKVPLATLRIGFLRKGSADLIGKALGMPDEIGEAVAVFVRALETDTTVPCDILQMTTGNPDEPPRHFAGYGGVGIFGRIPRYTENRFIKYYKGILGQLFGDMGPFFVGATLSSIECVLRGAGGIRRSWRIVADGEEKGRGVYQAMILVNGDLGKDLPFARGVPLGSGDFHLFAFRDIGMARLAGQFRHAWDASILREPARWGFEHVRAAAELRLEPDGEQPFPINVDGSTMLGKVRATCRIVDRVRLFAR